ncbi:hypothetical protein LIP_2318 [Limnochorda pilosa]|uniref:Uncharacterized protein TP-0789 domain-containing protein n=2 Tax=Limnochorda pilosa TaxID=1555112 RepID=A0A0K2SMY1_LIMPI|nr:hypothetical protein LIP_2318 [Limnochorda pilosa]
MLLPVILAVALVWAGSAPGAGAAGSEAAALSPDEILDRVEQNLQGDTRRSVQTMTLSSGVSQLVRTMEMFARGDDDLLVRFTEPADVAGTGLLVLGDDMWLYMPVVGRARRIAGSMREASFMGSDFSYDDMSALSYQDDYRSELLGTETLDGVSAYKLALTPTGESSYSSLTMWVDAERFVILRVDFFKGGTLSKTLRASDVRDVQGRPVPFRLEMVPASGNRETVIRLQEVRFDEPLDDGLFSVRTLERGR